MTHPVDFRFHVLAIIQARMGSTRLPGKVLKLLDAYPVIWHVYQRTRRAIPNTVVAIPASAENDPLAEYLNTIDAPVFRWDGPEDDVLSRYAACAKYHRADIIVRVTGDCPLIDPVVIRGMVQQLQDTGAMFLSNGDDVVNGFNVQVFTRTALELADKTLPEREHVEVKRVVKAWGATYGLHLSVDTADDLERVRSFF